MVDPVLLRIGIQQVAGVHEEEPDADHVEPRYFVQIGFLFQALQRQVKHILETPDKGRHREWVLRECIQRCREARLKCKPGNDEW